MVIISKNHLKQQPFVDRENYIQTFKETVYNIGQKKFSILVYYGIAGIGKTSLRKEFPKHLEKHNREYQYHKTIWASIDLRLENHREKNTFLVSLKNNLQKEYKIHFPAFEIAHAIYWKRAKPEIPLRKENYLFFEGDNAFDDYFGVVEKIPYFSIVPATARLLKNLPDYFRRWWVNGEEELLQLSEKEPLDIEEALPYFWAQDLNNYLEHASKSAVLFIDTYEALWENHRSDGHSRDKWIREELIPRLPRKVLWVICGKEALKWEEIDCEWGEYLTQYKVKELAEDYCIKYLETRGTTDKEIQEVIIKRSNGVPYYLELSADTYELIVKNNKKPKPENFGDNHQKIVDRFFGFLGDHEKNALNVLSVPYFWDYDLFKYLMKEFNTGYPINNFEDLCSFSFIDKTENNKLQMHQLMQESIQKTQKKKRPDSVKEIHRTISDYYTNKLNNIDIKEISSEHEIALMEAFYHSKESLEAQDLLNWYITASQPFNRAAFWQLIAPMCEEILQILENKLGFEHPDVATTLDDLAGLYYHMGDYKKALPLYQRALDTSEKILGYEHPDVSTILNNLAELYKSMGAYEKALPLFQRALNIREKVLGLEQDTAVTLSCLAGYYEIMGDYRKALSLFQRALEIQEKVLDPLHPHIATTLNNLAILYESMGDYEKALSLFQRALGIYEKVLGSEHPNVAATLGNLADLYRNVEDYEKALQLYQRTLDIREKILGPQHPDVAQTLNNLALLYHYKGVYGKALSLYKRALEIYENALGSEHLDVTITVNNLAGLYRCIGDYEKAFPLYQRTLNIREKVLGPQHLDVAKSLNGLAELYRQVGNYKKAFPLYQRALDIREKVLDPQHLDVAKSLNNLATLYENIGDYEKALQLYQKALDILERAQGSQHSDVAAVLNNLAVISLHMGDYEKALQLSQRASRILEDSQGSEHPDVAVSLKNLASLYEKTGNYEEALPLLERSLDIIEKKLGPNHPLFICIMNEWISVSEKNINE